MKLKHISTLHGNFVHYSRCDGTPEYFYLDDDFPVDHEYPRPCPFCGLPIDPKDQVDPCLGHIPGIQNACCGHGIEDRYFNYDNGAVSREWGHLWWQGFTFPGMDKIREEIHTPRIIGEFMCIRVDKGVWFCMNPIATIPWRTSIPRLRYPHGEDNLSKLQSVIDSEFNSVNVEKIQLIDRENTILASRLLTTLENKPESLIDTTVLNMGIKNAWIYDPYFFISNNPNGFCLRTQAPVSCRGWYFTCTLPYSPRYVYIVVRGAGGCLDRVTEYLDTLRKKIPFELV